MLHRLAQTLCYWRRRWELWRGWRNYRRAVRDIRRKYGRRD